MVLGLLLEDMHLGLPAIVRSLHSEEIVHHALQREVLLERLEKDVLGAAGPHGGVEVFFLERDMRGQGVGDLCEEWLAIPRFSVEELVEHALHPAVIVNQELDGTRHGKR